MSEVVIFDGLDRIGRVVERDDGRWHAYDAGHRDLGHHADRRAATDAVLEARRAVAR